MLRILGEIGGNTVELSRTVAADAVLGTQRFPYFPLAYDRHSIEIDLRGLPGEEQGVSDYYTAACAIIDQIVDKKLREGIEQDALRHLSVFAFARLPLLVYLGNKLDDTVPSHVFQRHRSTERWAWPETAGGKAQFETTTHREAVGTEAVLLLNSSGTVHEAEVPQSLRELPLYSIDVIGAAATMDVIDRPEVLARFEDTFRRLLSQLEATNKGVLHLHVIGAYPVSAAVDLGRVRNPQVHPALVVCGRIDNEYRAAIEVYR